MKVLKKGISICLAVLFIVSLFSICASAKADTQNVKINLYSDKVIKVNVPSTLRGLKFYVKSNSKSVVAGLFNEKGVCGYSLMADKRLYVDMIADKKSAKPVTVTLKYTKNGKKILFKKYKVTVAPMKKLKFPDWNVNKGSINNYIIEDPYCDYYNFKMSDKSKLEIDAPFYNGGYKYDGLVRKNNNFEYLAKGKSTGNVKVDVYLSNRKIEVGSFNVAIGDFKTQVRDFSKNTTLKYSQYGSNAYMSKSHIDIEDILNNKKSKAKYSVVPSDTNVVDFLSTGELYATGIGTASCSVYEKIGKTKTLVDKFNVSVGKAKMSYVARENYYWYDDGVFGKGEYVEYLNLTDNATLEMEDTIKTCLINNSLTGSHFKKSQYTITYKSDNPKIATVSKNGVVTAKAEGETDIIYSIKFSDKSVYKNICTVSVSNEW